MKEKGTSFALARRVLHRAARDEKRVWRNNGCRDETSRNTRTQKGGGSTLEDGKKEAAHQRNQKKEKKGIRTRVKTKMDRKRTKKKSFLDRDAKKVRGVCH